MKKRVLIGLAVFLFVLTIFFTFVPVIESACCSATGGYPTCCGPCCSAGSDSCTAGPCLR